MVNEPSEVRVANEFSQSNSNAVVVGEQEQSVPSLLLGVLLYFRLGKGLVLVHLVDLGLLGFGLLSLSLGVLSLFSIGGIKGHRVI